MNMNSKEIMVNLMVEKICKYIDAGDIHRIVVRGKEFAEVKKGVWMPISCAVAFGGSEANWGSRIAGYMCSECEEEVDLDTDYQYCPYCGAKMSDYYCEVVDDD